MAWVPGETLRQAQGERDLRFGRTGFGLGATSLPFVLSLSKDERKEHAVSVVAGRIKPPGCERGIQGAKTT
jgi:hypothetical protein